MQSTIMSALASSSAVCPAKLNCLAKNLAIAIDWDIAVPLYSSTGNWPHGVAI